MYRNKDFWSRNNLRLYIGDLAFLDFTGFCLSFGNRLGIIDNSITSADGVSKFYAYGTTFFRLVYYGSVALLSVSRYEALGFGGNRNGGLRYRFFTGCYSLFVLWIVSVIITLVIYLKIIAPLFTDQGHGSCDLKRSSFVALISAFAMIQVGIIIFSYIQIYQIIKRQNLQIAISIENNNAEKSLRGKTRKVTEIAFIITIDDYAKDGGPGEV